MIVDKLINTSYKVISLFGNLADVSQELLAHGYVAVQGDDLQIMGIVTIKDFCINSAAEISTSSFEKPRIQLGNTIIEVRRLMKASGNDFLPVYDKDEFIGVISIGSITDRLILLFEQTQINYQKAIHDLRNPIANIQGIIKIVSEGVNDEESRQMLELSTQSSKHAMDILEDLLFVETDEHKPLIMQETEMNSFFSDCIKEQSGAAYHKHIALRTEFVEQTIIKSIDRKQFKRAVQNIISNAIKFSSPGSVISISSTVIGDRIRLKIVDAGMGIPGDLHKDIFQKFSTAQRVGTNGEASTGLGLYFTKQCIERHKGFIDFESDEGKGTKFYITI
jgi:signal transduction histidine kinase